MGGTMVKAVIFDMDGLMIDSERVTYEGYVKEMTKRGYDYTLEFYKKTLGKNMATIYEMYYDQFGRDLDMDTVVTLVHKYMDDCFRTEGVPVKKGLRELLQYLKEHHYRTVLATSSSRDRADTILKLADIEAYFDASVCGDEVTNGKPNPETFLTACKKVGVKPEEALVLEDSEAGICAAAAGNIPVICVPDMKHPAPEFAEKTWKIVDSLLDVLEILRDEEGDIGR